MLIASREAYVQSETPKTSSTPEKVLNSPVPSVYQGLRCDWGWTRIGSKCYLAVIRPARWLTAEERCVSRGGHLATIDSPEVARKLETLAIKR